MTDERISDERLEWFLGPGCFATWLERTELVRGYRAATDADLERVAAIDALAALKRSSDAEIAALRAFAQAVMAAWPEDGIDGDVLQDIAESCGLLRREQRYERCGDKCMCAGYAEAGDWPVRCYRFTPVLTGNPAPDDQRQARKDIQGLGEPGHLPPDGETK